MEVQPRARKPPSRGEMPAVNGNGKRTAKGKGKAKATRKVALPPEPMSVDPIVIDEDEAGLGPDVARAMNSVGKNRRINPPTVLSKKTGEASSVADQLRRVRPCLFCVVWRSRARCNTGGSPHSCPIATVGGSISDTGD